MWGAFLLALWALLNAWALGDIEDLGIVEVVTKRIDQGLALVAILWGLHLLLTGLTGWTEG